MHHHAVEIPPSRPTVRRRLLRQIAFAFVPRLVLLGALLGTSGLGITGLTPDGGATAATGAVPADCSSGSYVWSHLKACGWAGPQNTGARPGQCPSGVLQAQGTDPRNVIHVTRRGAEIGCRKITGCLSVEAPGVTIHDVAIRCTTGRTGEAANGSGVIKVQDGASAVISHASTNGMRGVHACVWHQGTRLVVNKLDCRNVNDGIFSWSDTGYSNTTGDNFKIRNSYLHDFTTRTANGHVDGYQTEGAANGLIDHNTFLMTSDDGNTANSAVAIWDSLRSSHDILVRHNLIAGGGFSVYAHDYSPSEANPSGGYSVKDTRFVDNVFSKHLFGCVGSYGVWFPRGRPTDGWNRTGNKVLESGAGIDGHNPSYQGHACT